MKKIMHSLILSFFLTTAFSQKSNNDDDIYIYINNKNFIGDALGYKALFYMSSEDKRFQSDNYYFKIDFTELDYQSLYSLGTPIDISALNYIVPKDYFKDKSNCELHTELSLYKRIYIITDIPENKLIKEKDKSKKHIIWYTTYAGTLKDYIYTSASGKTLLED
jgi:hypothetical protein